MKKVFVYLAVLFLSVGVANAQIKEIQKAQKDLAKAKELVSKKGDKADSWLKLADAYRSCYEAPINGLSVGLDNMQAKIFLKDQRPQNTESLEVGGKTYTVETYDNKIVYYDEFGNVRGLKVLRGAIDEDALVKAAECYAKAKSMNVSEKDLLASVKFLCNDYWDMAMTGNTLMDYKQAAFGFENSYLTAKQLMGQIDTTSLYYAAIMSTLSKQTQKAIELSNECIDLGYQDGNLYAMLAENYKEQGQLDKAKDILQKGFEKFPSSQEILVQLINTYLDSKENPDKVFEFLHAAQKNEPDNPTLYYSEGNLYRELKQYDKAIEMFQKSQEIDPTYFYAPYSIGDIYYTMALEIQAKAENEISDAKYQVLNDQLSQCLKDAIAPFTRAFEIAPDNETKSVCAEFLKNIYFRFKFESEEYNELYNKYTKFIQDLGE